MHQSPGTGGTARGVYPGIMAFTNSGNRGAELNVTPLIDILLVLLIIFMVIAPDRTHGLAAELPQPADSTRSSDDEEYRNIVIQVAGPSSIRLNTEPVAVRDLRTRLLNIFKTRAERVVFVQATADTEFQHVAQVVDIAKAAQIDHVGLMPALQ